VRPTTFPLLSAISQFAPVPVIRRLTTD